MRRHPIRGCDCRTCANERAAQAKPEGRARHAANSRRSYEQMTEEQRARANTCRRNGTRRRAEARDEARLSALQGGTP